MYERATDLAPPTLEERQRLSRLRFDVHLGKADDQRFDELVFAEWARAKSARFWTPVEVAHRAAHLFASEGVSRVLDIGSGVGKFCLVAACACPSLKLTGIEQRPHLVAEALSAKARLCVENVSFHVGDATRPRWEDFDGLYFYNPFAENLYVDNHPLDNTVELSQTRLVVDMGRVLAALLAAPIGHCVVTYNGFGGPIPATYGLAHEERAGVDWLRVWVKRRPAREVDAYFREGEEAVTLVRSAAEACSVGAD